MNRSMEKSLRFFDFILFIGDSGYELAKCAVFAGRIKESPGVGYVSMNSEDACVSRLQ